MPVKRKITLSILFLLLLISTAYLASADTCANCSYITVDAQTASGKPISANPIISDFEVEELHLDSSHIENGYVVGTVRARNNGTDGYGTVKIETNDTNE